MSEPVVTVLYQVETRGSVEWWPLTDPVEEDRARAQLRDQRFSYKRDKFRLVKVTTTTVREVVEDA